MKPSFPLPGEAHVWRFCLTAEASWEEQVWETLSHSEQERARRFHCDRDRRRFVVRRGSLRQILADCCGCLPENIRFATGAWGKPELVQEPTPGRLRFSCSHSGACGLVAMTCDCAVGVDLEEHQPWDPGLAGVAGLFSSAEQEELGRLPAGARTRAFFDCWTFKEAFVKALGLGLAYSLDGFTVLRGSAQVPWRVKIEGDDAATQRWQLLPLDAGRQASAALVVEGRPVSVHLREWPDGLAWPGTADSRALQL